jgi:hypothetical protein
MQPESSSLPPAGWYENPQGPGLRWWDGAQWTEQVHAQDQSATLGRESPLKIFLGGMGALLGAFAFIAGGIALVAVVVTLLFDTGSGTSEPAPTGGSSPGSAVGASGTREAECERHMQALDKTAEILEEKGEIPSGNAPLLASYKNAGAIARAPLGSGRSA